MDIIKDFGVDPKKVREGVWIDLNTQKPVEESDIGTKQVIKLARAGNRKFTQAYTDKLLKTSKGRRNVSEDADLRMRAEVIADHVILDWRNLTANGQPFPYSREAVVQLVCDETYADFFDLITGLAQDVSFFRMQAQEEVVKNS